MKIFVFFISFLLLSAPAFSDEAQSTPPLPYEINFDVAAYMNCPENIKPKDPIFFTLKLGAYVTGLKLIPDFARTLSEDSQERLRQLEVSPSIDSQAQLTISKTGFPSQIVKINDEMMLQNTLALNAPSVIRNLAKDGISYKLADNKPVEIKWPWPDDSLTQLRLFLDLNIRWTTYLTYKDKKSSTLLGPREGLFYGSRFHFGFSPDKKYLTEVQSYDLVTDRSHGKWVCPTSLRFLVAHRNNDFIRQMYKTYQQHFDHYNLTSSECQSDTINPSPFIQNLLNVLMSDNFTYGTIFTTGRDRRNPNEYTPTHRRCIHPTTPLPGCYPDDTIRVEFEETNCTADGTMDATGNLKVRVCPAWLSVCIRQI